MTPDEYAAQLRKLLPRGRLWLAPAGTLLYAVLLFIAATLLRFRRFLEGLQAELDPRTASQLLPEWEAACGLPDGCIPGGGTVPQRRAAVLARLTASGGPHGETASRAYFIQLAAQFGYTISILESATNVWQVRSTQTVALTWSTCDSGCDDQLQAYGNQQLECLINRLKPAHTQVSFAYGV